MKDSIPLNISNGQTGPVELGVVDSASVDSASVDPAAVDVAGVDVAVIEPRLRRAFVARYGLEIGLDVAADTFAWAWENQDKLADVDNVMGYLFRVGQTKSSRYLRWFRRQAEFSIPLVAAAGTPFSEPGLVPALAKLDEQHRTAVVLVHSFQWTYAEVAELTGVPVHTVRNRVHRGLVRLRSSLGLASSGQLVDVTDSEEFVQ